MPKPNLEFTTPEKYWEDAVEGDVCTSPTYLVTAERIDAYAELSGDFTPVHVDEDYARASHFGQRVAHGLMGLAVADGLKTQSEYRFVPGMSLGWTWDFVLPIAIGDVLHIRFRIGTMRPSQSRPGWGIVVIPTELINQRGQVVQRGEHRLMVPRRPANPPLSSSA
jgi:acyl dehydratase